MYFVRFEFLSFDLFLLFAIACFFLYNNTLFLHLIQFRYVCKKK